MEGAYATVSASAGEVMIGHEPDYYGLTPEQSFLATITTSSRRQGLSAVATTAKCRQLWSWPCGSTAEVSPHQGFSPTESGRNYL